MTDLYDLLEDAIFEAGQSAHGADGNKTEYMSLIYQTPDGRYGFTQPMGNGNQHNVKRKLTYPKEALIKALVHNHPSFGHGSEDGHFSLDDVSQAEKLKVPSYIVYGDGVPMRSFTPGVDRLLGDKGLGQPFNHIPEVKVTAKKIAPEQDVLISALRKEVP